MELLAKDENEQERDEKRGRGDADESRCENRVLFPRPFEHRGETQRLSLQQLNAKLHEADRSVREAAAKGLSKGLQENARHTGEYLLARLRELAARHGAMGDVRGQGLFVGIELVRDSVTRQPAPSRASAFDSPAADLAAAVSDFRGRERRFGAVAPRAPVHHHEAWLD